VKGRGVEGGRTKEKGGRKEVGGKSYVVGGLGGVFPSSTELNREPISQSFGFGGGLHTNEMFSPHRHAIAAPPFSYRSTQPGHELAGLVSVVDRDT
jgi:hypothetical protein